MTLIAITVTGTFLLWNYHKVINIGFCESNERKITIQNFAGILANQLIQMANKLEAGNSSSKFLTQIEPMLTMSVPSSSMISLHQNWQTLSQLHLGRMQFNPSDANGTPPAKLREILWWIPKLLRRNQIGRNSVVTWRNSDIGISPLLLNCRYLLGRNFMIGILTLWSRQLQIHLPTRNYMANCYFVLKVKFSRIWCPGNIFSLMVFFYWLSFLKLIVLAMFTAAKTVEFWSTLKRLPHEMVDTYYNQF
jgi:hypothetical protein